MARRREEVILDWNFSKYGSFGHFKTDVSVPIEYVMTTFSIEQISKLSFARKVQTELNFDLLIQRDIDEKRAVEEISQYISPKDDQSRKDEIVFLPPLLVAVVGIDSNKQLVKYYPNEKDEESKDEIGATFIKKWGSLFQVTYFPQEGGYKHEFLIDDKESEIAIDASHVKIDFRLGADEDPGARLVVIDGQHRLFALQHLKKNHFDKVREILLPVCLLYSPTSTEINKTESIPSVPKVLRDLFVDVNHTVEKVSGHFVILLSDQTLGSIICREFCDGIMRDEENGKINLSLIEWNTKNHKESKTISKNYTLTSIGVIFDTIDEYFKKKSTKKLLRYILAIDSIDVDFGVDENDDPLPVPVDFPWRDFQYQHKPLLEDHVRQSFSKCLIKIFFETKAYKKHRDIYTKKITELENLQKSQTSQSNPAGLVLENILDFTPLEDNKKAKDCFDDFTDELLDLTKKEYPEIIRKNVFQKAIIDGWLDFIDLLSEYNLRVNDITDSYIELLNHALDNKKCLFDVHISNTYLQNSVYDNLKINANKESRNQIKRLILAFLGNKKVRDKIINNIHDEDLADKQSEMQDKLIKFGKDSASFYIDSLHASRSKNFIKSYSRLITTLDPEIRERLKNAEEGQDDDSQEEFKKLVKEQVKPEFIHSVDQLNKQLGYKTAFKQAIEDDQDDDE